MNNTPSTEERIWAVLAHLSAIAFGMGILLPVIGWSEQRRKSNYAAFQCLQALGYQSLGYTVWILGYLVVMIVFVVALAVGVGLSGGGTGNGSPILAGGMGIFFSVFILIGFAVYFLFPVIAAIACALGRDYRYPVMGGRLARYLGYDPAITSEEPTWLVEDHADRWVTAMGHVSVIIPIWGILSSITAWIVQGKRSPFLKFQSVQAVVYQVLVNVLNFLAGAIYMFGFLIFIALTGFESGGMSSTGMVGLGALFVSLLCAMLILLLLPLFHILGQWAGYRVLKGDDYRYPLVGRWVKNWISKSSAEIPVSPDGL